MKKIKKKGFTLVELVIVIAVIAILAAILIPTFSTLIRKSNINSDLVLAKNLNTSVNLYKAETGKETIDVFEAIEAVQKNGYVLGTLNAKANDCYFVWDETSNQFILIEKIKEEPKYKVLYSNEEGYGTINKSWCFTASITSVINDLKKFYGEEIATYLNVASSSQELNGCLGDLNNERAFLTDNIIISKNDDVKQIILENTKGLVTIDMQGKTISTNESLSSVPLELKEGNFKFQNGTISGSGELSGKEWLMYVHPNNISLTLENMVIYNFGYAIGYLGYDDQDLKDYVAGIKEIAPQTFEFIDSKFYCSERIFNIAGYSNVTIKGESYYEGDEISFVSMGSTFTIEDGEFNIKKQLFTINNTGYFNVSNTKYHTKIIIKDGTFYGDAFSTGYFLFDFKSGPASKYAYVEIFGGLFGGIDYIEYFSKYLGKNITDKDGQSVVVTKHTTEDGHVYFNIKRVM